MQEIEKGFKTALMGGFNREDVLQYIEKTASETGAQIERLQKENETLHEETDALRQNNAELCGKNAELLERLGEMVIQMEKATADAESYHAKCDQADAALREQTARAAKLEEENQAFRAKIEELTAQCNAYLASKERFAEIELAAYRRAQEVEDRAAADARRVRVQSAELISKVKNELQEVSGRYHAAIMYAKEETTKAETRAAGTLDRLDAVVAALDAVMVGELAGNAEEGEDQPQMGDVLDFMNDAGPVDGGAI